MLILQKKLNVFFRFLLYICLLSFSPKSEAQLYESYTFLQQAFKWVASIADKDSEFFRSSTKAGRLMQAIYATANVAAGTVSMTAVGLLLKEQLEIDHRLVEKYKEIIDKAEKPVRKMFSTDFLYAINNTSKILPRDQNKDFVNPGTALDLSDSKQETVAFIEEWNKSLEGPANIIKNEWTGIKDNCDDAVNRSYGYMGVMSAYIILEEIMSAVKGKDLLQLSKGPSKLVKGLGLVTKGYQRCIDDIEYALESVKGIYDPVSGIGRMVRSTSYFMLEND